MAIFDSEKRPKGFRVPSFGKKSGASKSQTSFHSKKSTGSVPPNDDPTPIPGPAAYPAPPRPRPPPNKELPPTPNEARGQPPPRTTSIPPPRPAVKSTSRPTELPPVAPQPIRPTIPSALESSARPDMRTSPRSNENISVSSQSIRPTVLSTLESSPRPDMSSPRSNENLSATSQSMAPAGQDVSPRLGAKSSARSFNLPVAPQPIQTMPQSSWEQPPPAETFSSVTAPNHEPAAPMDDYDAIIEDPQGPLEIMPDDGPTPRPLTPPEVEPVAAPLNKVHFMCFQEHRAMPAAPNVWCPVPCMTCHKSDGNVRYRCVFCCLRICQDCYQTLEKCRHRSLKELMYNIG